MLLSYLKLSLRLLARNPFFTFINVAGLSVGFAVFFILWQHSQSELKSDQQWRDWDRIYRFGFLWEYVDADQTVHSTQFGYHTPAIIKNVAQSLSEVEDFTRIYNQPNFIPEYIPDHGTEIEFKISDEQGESIFLENNLAYADPNVFDFFGLPLIAGDPATALSQSQSVVISESIAHKYFGNENPINKILMLNDSILFKITGVFKDLPHNTHLSFDILVSTIRVEKNFEVPRPTADGADCYFKLKQGASAIQFQKNISKNKKKYYGEILNVESSSVGLITPILQPLSKMAFSSWGHDVHVTKSRSFLLALSGISIVVLVMGWVNYVLLTSSFNKKRTIEFLARRTFGARPLDLIRQFLIESLVVNALAVLLAFTYIQISKAPLELWFQFYMPQQEMLLETNLILGFIITSGVILSGVMPSLYSFRTSLIKTRPLTQSGPRNLNMKGLSVFQYTIAIVLIVSVFVAFYQVNFMVNNNWGLNKADVIVVDLPVSRDYHFESSLSTLKNKLERLSEVEALTMTHNVLGDNSIPLISLKKTANSFRTGFRSSGGVDERFLLFYNIKLIEGRNFMKGNPADEQSLLISGRAIERMGFPDTHAALGQKIFIERSSFGEDYFQAWIIGVFEDYAVTHKSSIFKRNDSDGIVLTYNNHLLENLDPKRISLRIKSQPIEDAVGKIQKIYSDVFPANAFNWYFLDDHINRHYQSDKTTRNQLFLFTFLAIGIACLGLLGMISNKVVEKTKEIGIRKILGAELHQIAQIFLNTTFKQIIIAMAIGIPVAYYLTQQYLQKFSERIELQWWHFALPVLILILIMLATVASVLWKAAKSNPVEALKYE